MRTVVVATLVFICGVSAHAQVFQCKDENGNAMFSSYPCGENAPARDVNVASGKASEETAKPGANADVSAEVPPHEAGLSQEERRILAEARERDERRVKRRDETLRANAAAHELSKQRCEGARERLKSIRRGTYITHSEARLQRDIAAARQTVSEDC